MKKRFHIQSGEPQPSDGDEREWFVLDRAQAPCERDCYDCPGVVVFVGATRRAARQECAERNARSALEVMTYEQWIDYHRAQPGGWLVLSAPVELLRATYEQRLVTFDEMNNEI